MALSIIIPARNEASYLPTLLSSLRQARHWLHDRSPSYPVEIIVANNSSTDGTATIAEEHGAHVVCEEKRNVSAVRNRGASQATGEYFVFVDADYRVEGDFMIGIIDAFESNSRVSALGVSVAVEENELDVIRSSVANLALTMLRRVTHMGYGVFAFRRTYFEQLGGFDEQCYAYEDVEMHRAIRRLQRQGLGDYRILHHVKVYASARGFHRGKMERAYFRMMVSPKSRRNPKLCGYWYDR